MLSKERKMKARKMEGRKEGKEGGRASIKERQAGLPELCVY